MSAPWGCCVKVSEKEGGLRFHHSGEPWQDWVRATGHSVETLCEHPSWTWWVEDTQEAEASAPEISTPSSALGRMELSPDLISACLALEKYLENPKALTERELVRWGPGPEVGGFLLLHLHPGFSSTVSLYALGHGYPRILAGSWWARGSET